MEAVEYLLTLSNIDMLACATWLATDDGDAADGSDEAATGKSALHIAAIHDSVKIAELLINMCFPLCKQDSKVS